MLRVVPFSESSQIVFLLTAAEGSAAALARGAYRDKSAFGGPLDVLTRGVADLGRRRAQDLDLLHGFRVTHPYRGLRASWLAFSAASYVLEVLRAFSWPRDREAGLFPLLAGTLDGLERARDPSEVDAWLASFAARTLAAAGHGLCLDVCASCGGSLAADRPAALSPARGGALCRTCGKNATGLLSCTRGAFDLLRFLSGASAASAPRAERAALAEVRRALDRVLEYWLERPLHSRRVLDGLAAGRGARSMETA